MFCSSEEWKIARLDLLTRCLEIDGAYPAEKGKSVPCCCSDACEIALRVQDQLVGSCQLSMDLEGNSGRLWGDMAAGRCKY